MRIGFDISQTGTGRAGCGCFAHSLVHHLAEVDTHNEYVLYPTFGDTFWDAAGTTATAQIDRPNFRRGLSHAAFGDMQKFWRNPDDDFESQLGTPDIVHSNNFFCPRGLSHARLVYTLYDLMFLEVPESTTEANRIACFTGAFEASLRADLIVAISHYSRNHFLATFPHYPPDRIHVVHLASRFHLQPDCARPHRLARLQPGQFWLNVGTVEPRKNQRRMLQAYAHLNNQSDGNFPMVLAGGKGWLMEDFERFVDELGLRQDVVILGYADDAELQWLYQNCFAFLYPSLFEGFGLPVLEAMTLGAPIITSNGTSLPEIVGPAGLMVDPLDENAIFEAMRKLATGHVDRKHLRQQAMVQAREFSWDSTARRVLDLYQQVVAIPRLDATVRKGLPGNLETFDPSHTSRSPCADTHDVIFHGEDPGFSPMIAPGLCALPMGPLRWPLAVLFMYSAVFGCALWIKTLYSARHNRPKWPRTEEFLIGYSLLTALCLGSLVLAHSFTPGVLLSDLFSLIASASWIRRKPRHPRFRVDLSAIAVKFAFVGMVAAIYYPLLTGRSLQYRLPDVFDLPKHLSALASVTHASHWPLPNPFFPEAPFAYNPGLYLVPGIICRMIPWVELIPIIMAITLLLVVWHVLGLMQRLMLRLSIPRRFQFCGLLLATFLGNLTPLLVSRTPPIAFTLALEKLSPRWIDDPYTSFIYIPQHILAVGCILAAWLIHTSRVPTLPRLAAQALLVGSAVLDSFILAPLALTILAILFSVEVFRGLREADRPARVRSLIQIGIVGATFVALLGPLLFQVHNWAGSYGRPSLAMPDMNWKNWGYLLVSTGIVSPLAVLSVSQFRRFGPRVRRYYYSYSLLLLVGLLFFLFVSFPDSWLKFGVFLRLSAVPPATLGLYAVWITAGKVPLRLGQLAVAVVLVAHVVVSFRVIRPLVDSAFIRRDRDEAALVGVLRRIPANQDILLTATSQEICALVGRPVYMDFKPVRSDRYLPAGDWKRAEDFFGSIPQQLPRMYDRGIGTMVVPANSPEAASCEKLFGGPMYASSQWMVFRTKHLDDALGIGLQKP